ncbi:MAG: hypothetical protein QOF48_1477, partial [Verrucomicrobiota bacterium]
WVYKGGHDGPFQLHLEEIERGDWFEPERVDAWVAGTGADFASAFRLIWRRWRESKE